MIDISLLSWVILPVYGVCAVLSAWAAQTKRRDRHWLAATALFCFLILLRLIDAEDLVRNIMRDQFHASGLYASRRELQIPIALTILVLLPAASGLYIRNRLRQPGARITNLDMLHVAMTGFAVLWMLRLVSLHQTDRLLYAGGIVSFNHLADLGLCVLAGYAALRTIRRAGTATRRH